MADENIVHAREDDVVIAVDALGGDDAPTVVLDGVAAALANDPHLSVILCGPQEVVEPFAAAHDRCAARVTTEAVTMAEHPADAVRKKKDSSLVVGCKLVKEGEAQGFFSAGSTGACLAAGILAIGRIKGVMRPALATVIPSPGGAVILCDVGANADCKPEYIVQFATMASAYAKAMLGVENPRVGLLNIGEEETKGSQFAQACYAALEKQIPGFAGNAEGRDVLDGKFDVIVTDGFTGNVCLKTIEGTAIVLMKELKGIMKKSLVTKLGAATMASGLKKLKGMLDSDNMGGAPLLGVKGACIVGHGSSNAKAIASGVALAATMARKQVSEIIAQTV